jgi:hypothetical protein
MNIVYSLIIICWKVRSSKLKIKFDEEIWGIEDWDEDKDSVEAKLAERKVAMFENWY